MLHTQRLCIIHAITGKAVFTASRPANHEGYTGTKLTKTNQNQCIITSKTPPSPSSSRGMEALKLLMPTLREAERDGLRRQTETETERATKQVRQRQILRHQIGRQTLRQTAKDRAWTLRESYHGERETERERQGRRQRERD